MDFKAFKLAVAKQFEKMQKHGMYRVQLDKEKMYELYLNSFPAGTNEVFRKRTEHDCGCCKGFIRGIGNAVALIDNKIVSVWDVVVKDEPGYQIVADALSKFVKSHEIADLFLHAERRCGTDKNFEQLIEPVKQGATVIEWNHFFVNIDPKYVCNGPDIASKLNEPRTTQQVLIRGLDTITDEAVDTVLELISQNSLYRGEENKWAITEFRKLKVEYAKLDAEEKKLFGWKVVERKLSEAVTRIRNHNIGTLLCDLSEGYDLEGAVKSYELKAAGPNYKRPTALVSKKQIENAKLKLQELGLVSALERRYAKITDVPVDDILFANRESKAAMLGDVFDDLAAGVKSDIKSYDKVEEVTIEKFISDIVPHAKTVELLFENRLRERLMTLVAPVDPTAGKLFKWENGFSWAYTGDVADGIKERVKNAGGNVTGDLCCRLAWYNHDDLDLHMVEPDGNEIYFWNKGPSGCGGRLDVDMNAGSGQTREPVENIFYGSKNNMKEGIYKLFVHQFSKRESTNVGFDVEMDFMGEVRRFSHPNALSSKTNAVVAKFKYSKAAGIEYIESLPHSEAVRTEWNIPTQTFHNVNLLMLSPNHWNTGETLADKLAFQGTGNKHYFFILDKCLSDEAARPFYNEFLKQELDQHRKVFEMVGSKMKVDDAADQLSGLGFSSTLRNHVVCRVKGSFSRLIKIVF